MNIAVCNIGSSSLKFQLLDMPSERVLTHAHVERVGGLSTTTYYVDGQQVWKEQHPIANHRDAVKRMLAFLVDDRFGILEDLSAIKAIGFKTIQAGEKNGTVLLTRDVLEAMESYRDLAPAHNPPYLEAIYMFQELLPDTPLVGVFEPGFHKHAPEYAKVYGVPYEWIKKHGVIKYGYHGASHRFVTDETIKLLRLPEKKHKIISCHLGGSSSLCAFKDGVAIDTTMGFTPQTGLIQGTRIGDLDPYVLPYIMKKKGITLTQALDECSKNGGLTGLSGVSGDMRDINEAIAHGNNRARLARDKFIYDIKRYIGEFLVLMEGLEAITFTGGIGQQDADLRQQILSSLRFLGLELDEAANGRNAKVISTANSRIKALVLETNEEIVVARETVRVIRGDRYEQDCRH